MRLKIVGLQCGEFKSKSRIDSLSNKHKKITKNTIKVSIIFDSNVLVESHCIESTLGCNKI